MACVDLGALADEGRVGEVPGPAVAAGLLEGKGLALDPLVEALEGLPRDVVAVVDAAQLPDPDELAPGPIKAIYVKQPEVRTAWLPHSPDHADSVDTRTAPDPATLHAAQ